MDKSNAKNAQKEYQNRVIDLKTEGIRRLEVGPHEQWNDCTGLDIERPVFGSSNTGTLPGK